MNQINADLCKEWLPGWHLDLEYTLPRIVFSKDTGSGRSTCYIYEYKDINDHLKTCSLTNLEYLEAKLFYKEHCLELLKRKMEDRFPNIKQSVSFTEFRSQNRSQNGCFGSIRIKGDK